MDELRISSFGEAQALVNEFGEAANHLQELIAFTDRVSGQMQGIWEGDAIKNFMENYEEIKASLSKMVEIVTEMESVAGQKLDNLIAANV